VLATASPWRRGGGLATCSSLKQRYPMGLWTAAKWSTGHECGPRSSKGSWQHCKSLIADLSKVKVGDKISFPACFILATNTSPLTSFLPASGVPFDHSRFV
jgi:hypothetical protein